MAPTVSHHHTGSRFVVIGVSMYPTHGLCVLDGVTKLTAALTFRDAIIRRLAESLAWEALVKKACLHSALSGMSAEGLHVQLVRIACKGIRSFMEATRPASRLQQLGISSVQMQTTVTLSAVDWHVEDVLIRVKHVQGKSTAKLTKAMKDALGKHVHRIEMIAMAAAKSLVLAVQEDGSQTEWLQSRKTSAIPLHE